MDLHSNDLSEPLWHCSNGCGQKYKDRSRWYNHLMYECKIPQQFYCTVCGKEFSEEEKLLLHKISGHA